MAICLENTLLVDEIEKIRRDIPKLSTLSDDNLFNLVCYKYFYNDGNLEYSDYQNIYTDGTDDGGIDFITTYAPDDQQTNLIFAQCKLWENLDNKRDVAAWYKKMDLTIRSFKSNRKCADYNKNLVKLMPEFLDEAKGEGFNEELVIFIYSDFDEKREKEILEEIEKTRCESVDLKDYKLTIHFKRIIDNYIETTNNGKLFVNSGKIKLYKEENKPFQVIYYGEKGLFSNISAIDLQRLYRAYRFDGLFEQNLRYYTQNIKIDNEIRNSIYRRKKDFWYFNNGIIIACSSFEPDGDNIKLTNFSIINGGQTTVLIGDCLEGNEDFAIPCKIIRDDDRTFLAKVAEASNTQKKISDVDLKANAHEQKKLKCDLEAQKIWLEIKRGKVGSSKGKLDIQKPKGYNSDWSKISNEELGQLLLAFVFQEPGTARSNKKSIFSNEDTYKELFLNKNKALYDPQFIKSLLELNNYLDSYKNSDNGYGNDTDENAVMRYGELFIIAIIGFLIKSERKLIDFSYNIGEEDDIAWALELKDKIPEGSIFKEPKNDEFETTLNGLFQKIIGIIRDAHSNNEPNGTFTNFFKTNPKYRKFMLKRLIDDILKNQVERKALKENYLSIFNI